jgi:deoxyribodipyrimidine photo-lyase
MSGAKVPAERIEELNAKDADPRGAFILYWMTASHRTGWNFGLQRALELAGEVKKPLVVLDTLASGNRWDSDRLHAFALQGMADCAERLEGAGVRYLAFVEKKADSASDCAAALSKIACAVVMDEFPSREHERLEADLGARSPVVLEKVDGNGILPMQAAPRVYHSAYDFRRFLQANLRPHLSAFPRPDPLRGAALPPRARLPKRITRRWPFLSRSELADTESLLARLPIDHGVPPVNLRGGMKTAESVLRRFVRSRLSGYADLRDHPDEQATSGLSLYLHHGHISAHRVFSAVMKAEGWTEKALSADARGKRSGWWGVGESAEAFLDQLVTWRELGYNMAWRIPGYDAYASLPHWARETLTAHAADPRPKIYDLDAFASSRTHDPVWNAAQNQLVREGLMHNYLRMLWGKKILEWTTSPEEALDVMIELNNRYALDGRNPNSYSGIFWVLGRYDRAWGPERPIFGKIRYMTSESTVRKLRIRGYLERYAAGES